MIQGVIFDMDGTMIDSEIIHSQAFAEIIREYGKEPIPYKNGLVQVQGRRGDEIWKILKRKYHLKEEISILRKKRRKLYEEMLKKNIQSMPGLEELLHHLKKHNIPMAIASSSPKSQIQLVINTLAITDYFSALVGGEDVTYGKPHPESFLMASDMMHVAPQECLVIEDAPSGIIAARRAGMKSVAVPSMYTKHHKFLEADWIVGSLHDVIGKVVLHS